MPFLTLTINLITTKNYLMSTLSKDYSQSGSNYHDQAAATGLAARYHKLIEDLKFSHFALISLAILVGSCLGGVAAMYVLMAGLPIWAVGIGLAASLANLVACIAQAPTKWVVNLFTRSVIVNAILFTVSVLL
jgi:hypothetical protein